MIPFNQALKFFGWLRKILYLWVRSKSFPVGFEKNSHFTEASPVCYLLKTRSLTDLLVLDQHCREHNLPRPLHSLGDLESGRASVSYLKKRGFFRQTRHKDSEELNHLVKWGQDSTQDIQVVPVSIFWGRNPTRQDQSLFRLLFFDDENGGIFQRLFTFIAHGREVVCHFAQPISMKTLFEEAPLQTEAYKKLRRIMSIHFRKQREAILGPSIYDRPHVISQILSSKAVQDAIYKEAGSNYQKQIKTTAKARKYADEIAARSSHQTIRFFIVILNWLWKKVYDGVSTYNHEPLNPKEQRAIYLLCFI